jgi:hypothetical protein
MNFRIGKFAATALLFWMILISTSTGFTISGAVFINTVSPGQELVHEVTLSADQNDTPLNMTAEVYGFAISENGANVQLLPEKDTGRYSARQFLRVSPKSFQLLPGGTQKVLITGTVPEDVGSGGRYALVTIKTAPIGEGNVAVSTAVQVPVLLKIADSDFAFTGKIASLDALKADRNISLNLEFENTGNVHYTPFVGAVLKSTDGRVLAEVDPEQLSQIILPNDLRLCKIDLIPEAELAPGTYRISASVTMKDGTVLDSKETQIDI